MRYYPSGKRLLDVAGSVVALAALSPLLLVLGGLVRVVHGAPILFHQPRAGWAGRPFTLYKFRTMTDTRDGAGRLLPDEARLTAFGRLLRSTSLDELPELWNVLRGEMSLVGPRPLLVDYLPLYSPEQARRHDVRPGITGWAQVKGRNALTWEEKFHLDVWYAERVSLGLDLEILFRTLRQVVTREGISEPGQATAQRFTGNAGVGGHPPESEGTSEGHLAARQGGT